MKLNPYLSFDGNCAEAFAAYSEAFGTDITMKMTFGEMPVEDGRGEMPEAWADRIAHMSMQVGEVTLMGCDSPPDSYQAPQGVHVSINLSDIAEAERVYGLLSADGAIDMPMTETFWAQGFAIFTDRFGTPWMINCEKPMPD